MGIMGGNRRFKNTCKEAPNFERFADRIVATLTTKVADWLISSCLEQFG
jgi:hypothetical protein